MRGKWLRRRRGIRLKTWTHPGGKLRELGASSLPYFKYQPRAAQDYPKPFSKVIKAL